MTLLRAPHVKRRPNFASFSILFDHFHGCLDPKHLRVWSVHCSFSSTARPETQPSDADVCSVTISLHGSHIAFLSFAQMMLSALIVNLVISSFYSYFHPLIFHKKTHNAQHTQYISTPVVIPTIFSSFRSTRSIPWFFMHTHTTHTQHNTTHNTTQHTTHNTQHTQHTQHTQPLHKHTPWRCGWCCGSGRPGTQPCTAAHHPASLCGPAPWSPEGGKKKERKKMRFECVKSKFAHDAIMCKVVWCCLLIQHIYNSSQGVGVRYFFVIFLCCTAQQRLFLLLMLLSLLLFWFGGGGGGGGGGVFLWS